MIPSQELIDFCGDISAQRRRIWEFLEFTLREWDGGDLINGPEKGKISTEMFLALLQASMPIRLQAPMDLIINLARSHLRDESQIPQLIGINLIENLDLISQFPGICSFPARCDDWVKYILQKALEKKKPETEAARSWLKEQGIQIPEK